ncbi:MAG: bifunctional demethylmenaquinone methyltransferase/2-methoxy-6-polyprenyl-1,4-benzoquinol methylase UbiE [Candidatus Hydrogenedentes bacterium]|nr:bifunctional demethylmenaquinone methyltransferase/2-methoxy-6-polyprenyl-1,4-benzoquinol methylase UbiE [Candidatus Hydrogenedentota bacterium]
MPNTDPQPPSRMQAFKMFDRIAHRYDLLNRLLSMGTDVRWRRKLNRRVPAGEKLRVLDLATGTADVLIAMNGACPQVASGVGLDMSGGMLHYGREKLIRLGLDRKFRLVRGDATCLGLESGQFDAVTISFGIRNVIDVAQGLREMRRILKPGGRALILEFSLPSNRLFRAMYLSYFRNILPRIGALISGDSYAYRYLNETVETFPYGEDFCQLMRDAGFEGVTATPLTFGIASLYQGDRGSVDS